MNAKSNLLQRIIWMLKRALRNARSDERIQKRPRDHEVFVI